ncbi:MAG: DUF427 domain-containing protein [Acidimicrobiia bacterium]|nr:DUF427 domain-containing protein [Acidimicrobiia bacterium]
MARIERIEPGPNQESVWDYPRPPRLEPTDRHIVVRQGDTVLADTRRALRVLETSQPPAYYLPPADVRCDLLVPSPSTTFCEWKGIATYWSLPDDLGGVDDVAWAYLDPVPSFEQIRGYLAFYAQRLDACFVDGEQVEANPGSFYGGWITSHVVGPFKGGPGTAGW